MEKAINILRTISTVRLASDDYQLYISELDIPLILDNYDIFKKECKDFISYRDTLISILYRHRAEDVLNYFEDNYLYIENGNAILQDMFNPKVKSHIKNHFIKNIDIDVLVNFIDNLNNPAIEESIYNTRKNDIENYLRELIDNETPLLYFNAKVIIKFISRELPKKMLLELLDYSKINKNAFNILYEIRKKDIHKHIDRLMLNGNDIEILNLLHVNIPESLLKYIFSKPYIKTSTLKEILINKNIPEKIKNFIYNHCNKKYKKIILQDIENDNYQDYINDSVPAEVIDFTIKNLDNTKFIDLLLNPINTHLYKNLIIHRLENKSFINLLLDMGSEVICNIVRLNKNLPELKQIVLRSSSNELIKLYFKYLTDDEKHIVFLQDSKLVKEIIIEELNSDPQFFSNYFQNSSKWIKEYVLSIITYEEIIDLIINNSNYYMPQEIIAKTTESGFIDAIKNYVINNKQNSKSTLFLEKIYNCNKDLFFNIIDLIDINMSIVYILMIDYRISIEDRELILDKYLPQFKNHLISNSKDDYTYITNLLKSNIPDKLTLEIIEILGIYKFRNLIHDITFYQNEKENHRKRQKYLLLTFKNSKNEELIEECIQSYNKDNKELVDNFDDITNYLEYLGIDINSFFQYSLNSSYNYIPDLKYIIENSYEDFNTVYNYLKNIISEDNPFSYNSLFLIIKNYIKYPELCTNITNSGEQLSPLECKNLLALFKSDVELSEEQKPKVISDCNNIYKIIINNIKLMAKSNRTSSNLKNCLSLLMFNISYKELIQITKTSGKRVDFERLLFDNQYDEKLLDLIRDFEKILTIIESITSVQKSDYLEHVLYSTIHDIENNPEIYEVIDIENKIREIFAYECNSALLKIDNDQKLKEVFDKVSSNIYGVKCYDFRKIDYQLCAHVLSKKETVEDVVNGVANGRKNFISLSSISYLNQIYYSNKTSIIFGYDEIPPENFIVSSSQNISSNRLIKNYSSEINSINCTQKGMLESSKTNINSEILCYRENIKPKYIIVPDREPTEKEIEIAKKYDLIICKTQGIGKSITNPKLINYNINKNNCEFNNKPIEKHSKTIGIITDIHGLYQPLLEVLEDLRKKGFTEIYSLGDNVGTGPDPSEVITLLEKYNVKSIKGNQEHYVTDGVDKYRMHLKNSIESDYTKVYNEAKINSEWTRTQITEKQLDIIDKYPEAIELELGDQKILLTHSLYDYNTGEKRYNNEDYDAVIQGHIHFRGKSKNIITLRGLAIGETIKEKQNKAVYYTLTVQNNEIIINEVPVEFDQSLLNQDLNRKEYNTKKKIIRWVGEKK